MISRIFLKIWTHFFSQNRGDYEDDNMDEDDDNEEDDELGAQLEREFLGDSNSLLD